MLLLVSSLLVSLLRTQALYVNNSEAYSNGSLGNGPSIWAWGDHTWPLFNYDPFPSDRPEEGYLLLAPRGTNVSKPGAYILNWNGSLVWDGSDYGQTMAFSTQTYLGNQVLTLWVGEFNSGGYGYGKQIILDHTYTNIVNVSTTMTDQGITNDFHEFQITANDTALIDMYITTQYDLSAYNVTGTDGGEGWIMSGAAQEIDVQTGQALWSWNALDHVDPEQCYSGPGTTGTSQENGWDYFHLNAVEKDSKGNFLLSSRHCHAVYYVSGQNGSILWTVGGKNSSFTMGDNTTFAWQHDARWRNNETQISLFDNGASSWETTEPVARGIILNVHMDNMSITLDREFFAPTNQPSVSQGSMELQANGNWLIGWGSQPWVSEFYPNGTEAWSFEFGLSGPQSYRALRSNWTGYPTTTPFSRFEMNSTTEGQYGAYFSWNGATNIAYWLLQASSTNDGNGLTSIATGQVFDFQTYITFQSSAVAGKDYLQGAAYSNNGSVLGYTDFFSVSQNSTSPPAENESKAVTIGTASFTGIATSTSTSTSTSAPISSQSGGTDRSADFSGGMAGLSSLLLLAFGMALSL